MNRLTLTSPSPSRSASSIISCSSSSVKFSPNSFATRFRFLNEIVPVSSSSNRRKALRISSFVSFSAIFTVISDRKSANVSFPLPSLSMSAIIFLISSFLGSNPRARIATFNSLMSMTPVPEVSNRSKASLMSFFCSSVNSNLGPDFFREAVVVVAVDFFPCGSEAWREEIFSKSRNATYCAPDPG